MLFKGGMRMLAWELVGAVVGAGMASGREIAAFFTRYGQWGMLGILLSVGVLMLLSDVGLPASWLHRWPAALWRILMSLLLAVTGSAMLSGAGEVAALTLAVPGAYWLGMVLTLMLAWLLAKRTVSGLAWVSRGLLAVLAVLILLGFTVAPMRSAALQTVRPAQALWCGVTYGGFNAALQAPIMAMAAGYSHAQRKRHALAACAVMLCLLMLGNAVLLRHPSLMGEPMPFLRMMNSYGKFGYWLGAISLYLAILSTLTACLRGLPGTLLPILGIILVSALGFTGVVERVYPVLGGSCFLLLLAAKCMNCDATPFHKRKDML